MTYYMYVYVRQLVIWITFVVEYDCHMKAIMIIPLSVGCMYVVRNMYLTYVHVYLSEMGDSLDDPCS